MSSSPRVWLRWLRRRISRAHWAAQWFGLSAPRGRTDEPGLIMLQIDGLSRKQVEAAMRRGRMPFFARQIAHGSLTLESFYSGVPSTTPAVQAEIFYGVKTAVPSFQFMRRSTGQLFRMYEAESARVIEGELEQQGEPLLADGHSYSNIYRAGSVRSAYCSQDLDAQVILQRMNVLKSLILAAFHFVKIVRILGLAVLELLLAVVDFFGGLFERRNALRELLFVPARVTICLVIRELIRFRALLAIESGVRVIHANFLGYDEQAHRRGPGSAFAHWSLKGIDRAVRDIVRASRRSDYRRYRVIIYSDHGQEKSIPFLRATGRPIEDAVAEALLRGSLANRAVFIPKIPEIIGSTITRCRKWFGLKPMKGTVDPEADLREKIVITALGPIGHIYLPEPLDRAELESRAADLVAIAHIPLVLVRPDSGDGAVTAINRHGSWQLPRDAAEVLGERHPFLEEAAADLARLCRHPDAGDFVISGWSPEKPPLSFAHENGAHGGPGVEETHGFALVPPGSGRLRGETLRSLALRLLERHPSESL